MVSHRASFGAADELTDDHPQLLADAYQRASR